MAYQMNTKQFNHNLYLNIMKRNFAEAKKLIDIGFNEISFKFKDRRGFISLVLNFYISQEDEENIDNILSNNFEIIMKRDLLNCSKFYYKKDFVKSKIIFEKLLDNYYFDDSCLNFILDNNMNKFLNYLHGKYLTTEYSFEEVVDLSQLKKIMYDSDIVCHALTLIDQNIKMNIIEQFKSKLKENFIDCTKLIIIDAGNILFCKSGKVTIKGYKYLLDIIEYLKSMDLIPVVVIHTRHLKKKFKNKLKNDSIIKLINILECDENIFIIQTPYNVNDDFYIVYLCLYYQCKVVTNEEGPKIRTFSLCIF